MLKKLQVNSKYEVSIKKDVVIYFKNFSAQYKD